MASVRALEHVALKVLKHEDYLAVCEMSPGLEHHLQGADNPTFKRGKLPLPYHRTFHLT